jgi:carbon-monoxide dehydrogenase large subunit
MRRVAGVLLGRPEEYVEREGEAFRSGDAAVTWREVCYEAYHPRLDFETLGLDSTAYYEPEDFTRAPGACLAFVSVDAECGRVRIERLLAIHDAGRVVNLSGVETVLRRGVLEGVDFSLSERIRLDDGRSSVVGGGRALAPWVECHVVETPCPLHPLEARPVAQAGFVASVPAIALAVLDALESVGVRGGSPPWTPERVWRRIRESAGACS